MVRPDSVEDWFHFVPRLLEDEAWQIAGMWPTGRQNRSTTILHRSSPWGGHLVRFSMKGIEVHDPPADTSHLFVRPEVRAWALRTFPELKKDETFEVLDQLAPGDATVERWASWKFFRLCVLFFGTLGGESLLQHFYHPVMPGKLRQVVRRNYPQRGDSALAMQSLSGVFEALLLGRPQEPGSFVVDFVLQVPRNIFAEWVSAHFAVLCESGRRLAEWFVNRPGIVEMRTRDMQCYVILTIQSWRRGRPLVPAVADELAQEDVTRIDAGKRHGLACWVRYHPRMVGSSSFLLSEYLTLFLERIGEQATLYQSMDGQELLPYQCAMSREDWDRVRDNFHHAYRLQKAAYRHARGGVAAAGVHEIREPRFCAEQNSASDRLCFSSDARLKAVVRNTFIEVEEELPTSACKRNRTFSPIRDWVSAA